MTLARKTKYAYKMGGVVWRAGITGQRIGIIHGEGFNIEHQDKGFQWKVTRRKTGETWVGITIAALVRQVWIDLHDEMFDTDTCEVSDNIESCDDCVLKDV